MPVRKRFGQHFLTDQRVLARIVDAIDPIAGERVVEIGPGRGALTWRLLERAGYLDAIEIDRDLAQGLRADARSRDVLKVHAQDALTTDFTALRGDGAPLRIVGNLPYNISTPILFHLLTHRAAIADLHFMLQKEVVDRIVAGPGGKEYGRLTVMLAIHATAERLFDVGPEAFRPAPKVWSSVLRLVPRGLASAEAAVDNGMLRKVVSAAFSHRRKTLRNALKSVLAVEIIEACGIDPQMRPETLSPTQYLELAQRAVSAQRVP